MLGVLCKMQLVWGSSVFELLLDKARLIIHCIYIYIYIFNIFLKAKVVIFLQCKMLLATMVIGLHFHNIDRLIFKHNQPCRVHDAPGLILMRFM